MARDDDTVHADEQQLMAAEKQLEVETAAKVGPAPKARAQDAAHRRGRRAAKRVYFPRAVRHEQAKSLLGKAQKDLAVSAKDHAKLRKMQEHIKLVMSETPGDKAEAQKEEQEEEFITNKLMKRLAALKDEKEHLVRQVEMRRR